eukprot:CAMPEP_0167741176 /NCGR_PEP_ID=MMETSP0110_2-20121227/712_1 /TAXON_ID=629695 /ORGANISM="Gymnochlora sp., Strain CCMP2014" /LENGTH=307 /DNA_ID=CAMNT_0007625201 /DNA_START=117 /DNA_END=1040 /DNA_ORIENTATION=-
MPKGMDVYVTHRPLEKDVDPVKNSCSLAIVPYAGIPLKSQEMFKKMNVAVGNLHHNASMTAEIAIGLLMSAAKNLLYADSRLRQNDWTPRGLPVDPLAPTFDGSPQIQLAGEKMLIIGYGHLGKKIAKIAIGMSMEVTALRRSVDEGKSYLDGDVKVGSIKDLHKELPSSVAVMVCCPGTPETKDMIDTKEFSLMSKSTIFVNVGRGSVVNEEALYHALKTRTIFAAGIDTWYQYPKDFKERSNCPPSSQKFYELQNIVMSPHRGGAVGSADGTSALRLASRDLAKGLNGLTEGKQWPHPFDLSKGY